MPRDISEISFGEKEELVFLGKEISEERNYSEQVAALIDKEVEKIIAAAQKEAQRVLSSKKKLLEKIARTLVEKETIEKEEFEKLISSSGARKDPKKSAKDKKTKPLKIIMKDVK